MYTNIILLMLMQSSQVVQDAVSSQGSSKLSSSSASSVASAIGARRERDAFLLGFDQNGDYDSPNFIWHRDRFARFLYVDRIAVAATHRRRGLAGTLYKDIFAFTAARGLERVVCEVNSDPPNPASDAFHDALGFQVVGEAFLGDRGKTVRYLSKEL